jgi:pimeloyl-ACP methyl ester carboxylesterase
MRQSDETFINPVLPQIFDHSQRKGEGSSTKAAGLGSQQRLPLSPSAFSLSCRPMSSHFYAYRSSRIHYLRLGSGPQVVVCLHGFGESAQHFSLLEKAGGERYTLLAIDLPLHGDTEWEEGLLFLPEDLVNIVEGIVAVQCGPATFLLLGYSMGGRMSLQLLQLIPQRIAHAVLLAPDGLKLNFWYWLATQTAAGNRLFKYVMKNPRPFKMIAAAGKALGLLNESVYKFVFHFLDSNERRKQVYRIWTCMRKIKPQLPLVKKMLPQHNIQMPILYGKYDRIIRYGRGEAFRKGIEPWCRLHLLDCGHKVLHERNANAIVAALQHIG